MTISYLIIHLKKNLSYNFKPSYREIKVIDSYSFPHFIINLSEKRLITILKYKQYYKYKYLYSLSKVLKIN